MFYLGIDFGTSGARACVIDPAGLTVAEHRLAHPVVTDDALPDSWFAILQQLILGIPAAVRLKIAALAIDGTSTTVVLCNKQMEPVSAPLWYHDSRARQEALELEQLAGKHIAASATSSLAKLLWLSKQNSSTAAHVLLHQSDWLSAKLCGVAVSDYHNALKLGYDPQAADYPDWIKALPQARLLPRVVEPGSRIAPVQAELNAQLGLAPGCLVHAGTTDSLAALMATGPVEEGLGVTSLGSTLVLKQISPVRIEDADHGIYSHKYGSYWLVGGASNSGGAVLAHYFSAAELQKLSAQIDPDLPGPLDYYPLLKPGERFPVSDPAYEPRMTPVPSDPAAFLQAMLEGIARIEAAGYALFERLGAPKLKYVVSTGGGSYNPVFSRIRQRLLGVPVTQAKHTEAAYGAALLAAGKIWGQS